MDISPILRGVKALFLVRGWRRASENGGSEFRASPVLRQRIQEKLSHHFCGWDGAVDD